MKNKYNCQKFNYIQYTEPNIFNRRKYLVQNNQNQNKNINNKKLNRFRSATKINNNINKVNYLNKNMYSNKKDIFDIRIYFCLKMLGLSHLQNIFERYGAYNAANLDGGSSATMYYDGNVVNKTSTPIGERYLPNAIIVEK